jgi:hypothetical protein
MVGRGRLASFAGLTAVAAWVVGRLLLALERQAAAALPFFASFVVSDGQHAVPI